MVYQTFCWLFSSHQYAKRLLLSFQSLYARFELTEQTQNKNVHRFHVLKVFPLIYFLKPTKPSPQKIHT